MTCAISIMVMAYDERETIGPFIEELKAVLEKLGKPYEVVIIDDGSTDGTQELADDIAKNDKAVRIIHHGVNEGLGEVYRTGFAEARGEYITFFPADGQFPPAIIGQFLPLMSDSDMVLGYLPKRRGSIIAKGLSMAEKAFFYILFGALPRFQGIVMLRRSLFTEIRLKSKGRGWTVLMELIIRAKRGGYRLTSVPTEMRPRTRGRSKVNNPRTIFANLRQAIALRLNM